MSNLYTFLAAKLPSCQLSMSTYSNFINNFAYIPIHLNEPNDQIMCDEYTGDAAGDVTDYWNFYKTSYTYNSNMNWVHVLIIVPGPYQGRNSYTGNLSSNWWQLFTEANNLGESHVWLYAYQVGRESDVLNFCNAAFQSGWMKQYQLTLATLWQCNNQQSCTNCSWPNGNWTILEANMYWNGQWIEY